MSKGLSFFCIDVNEAIVPLASNRSDCDGTDGERRADLPKCWRRSSEWARMGTAASGQTFVCCCPLSVTVNWLIKWLLKSLVIDFEPAFFGIVAEELAERPFVELT